MVEPILIRSCLPAELPALIALLDEEFIVSKGRSLSLAQRFPAVLQPGNCADILLACRGAVISACVVVKRFDWITPERTWRGAIIGMVYTRPAERGSGLASELLRAAEQILRADGTDFAVLWTTQPEIYRRLGWVAADCGVFGTWSGGGGAASAGVDGGRAMAGCAPASVGAVESLRGSGTDGRTARGSASYLALPLPAERLQLLASPCGKAYAICGERADQAYVYEFGGTPSAFAALWEEISAVHSTVYINDRRGSASQLWLASLPSIKWRDQGLAMWQALAEPACERHFPDWYVPYLDRI